MRIIDELTKSGLFCKFFELMLPAVGQECIMAIPARFNDVRRYCMNYMQLALSNQYKIASVEDVKGIMS